jgi:hypothetical protein
LQEIAPWRADDQGAQKPGRALAVKMDAFSHEYHITYEDHLRSLPGHDGVKSILKILVDDLSGATAFIVHGYPLMDLSK